MITGIRASFYHLHIENVLYQHLETQKFSPLTQDTGDGLPRHQLPLDVECVETPFALLESYHVLYV